MTDEANQFVNNYRQSLQSQYDTVQKELSQQRANDYTTIMSQANKAGSLYSNIPARSKIQYDTQTYYPSLQKIYTSYQTGIDKLRSNVADYQNQIKALDEAMADINADTMINQSMY